MMKIKNYVRPQTLQEAYELNQPKRNKIIGGMLWLKMTDLNINTAIDLCDLKLDTIEETEDAFIIGSMVTLRQLECHEGLNAYTCGAMRKAVQDIVGVQFRNSATVGGSIFGRFGFSDVLTQLLSTDCYVELYKRGMTALEEFVGLPRDKDLLVRLVIKKTPGRFSYEAMRAQRTDFPVLTCAASKTGSRLRVVIGARPMKATVLTDREGILSHGISEESALAFADYAAKTIATASNLRGSAAYRTHLVKVLTKRALLALED